MGKLSKLIGFKTKKIRPKRLFVDDLVGFAIFKPIESVTMFSIKFIFAPNLQQALLFEL